MHMTRKSLEEAIQQYNTWKEEVEYAVENLEKENEYLDKLGAAPKTAAYGIQATMPRAGGISDPTANAALKKITRKKELDHITKRKQASIQFIDERRLRLETIRDDEILQMLMDGRTDEEICAKFNINQGTGRTIRQVKMKIFNTMLKE